MTSRARLRSVGIAAAAVAAFVILAGAFGAGVLYSGWYGVEATDQHLRPTFRLLDVGLRRSVERRASAIATPALNDPALLERGIACFRAHCEQCHGGPGVPRAEFAKGLLPVASSLSQASADWKPAELYWITRKGIKMTGMPAWEYRLDDGALWAVVAFLQVLPELSPARYRDWASASRAACEPQWQHTETAGGDAARGKLAIQQYACTACHRIPGVVGPDSRTGPPLTAMSQRRYIAGVLPNTHANMVLWLRSPKSIRPHTAMPDLGVSESHSRDIAAYLGELR
jgi:cytochrome c1